MGIRKTDDRTWPGRTPVYASGHVQKRRALGLVGMTPRGRPFRIEYADAAMQNLRHLSARQRALVLDVVEAQLAHQPTLPTRNRKLLRANRVAPWELRIGDIRVYFDATDAPEGVVTVRAVGVKVRDRVLIGGEEVDLT